MPPALPGLAGQQPEVTEEIRPDNQLGRARHPQAQLNFSDVECLTFGLPRRHKAGKPVRETGPDQGQFGHLLRWANRGLNVAGSQKRELSARLALCLAGNAEAIGAAAYIRSLCCEPISPR